MSVAVRYWRVTFNADGSVRAVKPLKGPGHERWVVVEAADEPAARRKAYNLYCARKKQERKTRCHEAGQCVCGRRQDRLVDRGRRKGEWALTCSVCAERRHAYHENAKGNPGRTFAQAMAERDEPARIAANLAHQRDRRGELRLETLIEVRDRWVQSPTRGQFQLWLQGEIDTLTGKGRAA